MRKFGASQAMGRRSVPRTQAPTIAVLSVDAAHYHATIVDISRTGARLCGDDLPVVGDQVTFGADKVNAVGAVVWRDLGACAVEFDTPIAISEVQRLRWLGMSSTELG
jgi:hypothetical protein